MLQILTPADYRPMRWKNGGGRTTEIAAYPPRAAIDEFWWRISIADVDRDGPFSPFPGVERTVVLIEGKGMRLRGRNLDACLAAPYVPHAFSGDDAIECTLVAGPIRDFNAMCRRDRVRGSVSVVRGECASFAPSDFLLVYAASGMQECAVGKRSPTMLERDCSMLVDRSYDDERPSTTIRPLVADAVALVVAIDRT